MGAENAFEFAADPFNRCAGALVALIGVEADAEHLPDLERVSQHEQLGFSIGAGANGGAGQPGVANLAHVGTQAAVPVVPSGQGKRSTSKKRVEPITTPSDWRTVAKGTAVPASRQLIAVLTYCVVSSMPRGTKLQR